MSSPQAESEAPRPELEEAATERGAPSEPEPRDEMRSFLSRPVATAARLGKLALFSPHR